MNGFIDSMLMNILPLNTFVVPMFINIAPMNDTERLPPSEPRRQGMKKSARRFLGSPRRGGTGQGYVGLLYSALLFLRP